MTLSHEDIMRRQQDVQDALASAAREGQPIPAEAVQIWKHMRGEKSRQTKSVGAPWPDCRLIPVIRKPTEQHSSGG